jgi:hypothetical protein
LCLRACLTPTWIFTLKRSNFAQIGELSRNITFEVDIHDIKWLEKLKQNIFVLETH